MQSQTIIGLVLSLTLLSAPTAVAVDSAEQRLEQKAASLKKQHQYQQALDLLLKIKSMQPMGAADWPLLLNIGECYEAVGKVQDAESAYKGARIVGERARGEGHAALAPIYLDLGSFYMKQKRYSEAAEAYKVGYQARSSSLHQSADVDALCNELSAVMGIAFARSGSLKEAEGWFGTWAADGFNASLQVKIEAFKEYEKLLRTLGDQETAASVHRKALNVLGAQAQGKFGSSVELWQSYMTEGETSLARDAVGPAEKWVRQAIALAESTKVLKSKLPISYAKLASIYTRSGQFDRARSALSSAELAIVPGAAPDPAVQQELAFTRLTLALGRNDLPMFAHTVHQYLQSTRDKESVAELSKQLQARRKVIAALVASHPKNDKQLMEQTFREILSTAEKRSGNNSISAALARELLGNCLQAENKTDDSLVQFRIASEIFARSGTTRLIDQSRVSLESGDGPSQNRNSDGDVEASGEAGLVKSMKLAEQCRDPEALASSLERLTDYYRNHELKDKAQQCQNRLAAVYQTYKSASAAGRDDFRSRVHHRTQLTRQAESLEAAREFDQAVAVRNQIVAICEKQSQYYPVLADAVLRVGQDYVAADQLALAEPLYVRYLQIFNQHIPDNPASYDQALAVVGKFYLDAHISDKALAVYQQLVMRKDVDLAHKDPAARVILMQEPLLGLEAAYVAVGSYAGAEQVIKRLMTLHEEAFGLGGGYAFADVLQRYADLLNKTGREEEAKSVETRISILKKNFHPAD